MQTRKVFDYADLTFEKGGEKEHVFVLSKGREIEVDIAIFSDTPFMVAFRTSKGDVPINAYDKDQCKFLFNQRVKGVDAVVVTLGDEFFHRIQSKAIGIAPMDTTPMEITTQLPAPTMEEIIRREFNKRFPQKGNVHVEPDIEDEVLQRSGGKDYTIDDDDPDDPLEVSPADINRARQRKRAASRDRVQSVDAGSDPGQGPDRGGSAQDKPPSPASGESGD